MQYIELLAICLLATAPRTVLAASKYITDEDLAKCPKDAVEAGDCIKILMNELIPRMRFGDPELNIEPYDPLVINRLSFLYSTGTIDGKISVRNVKIYGFAQHKVDKVNIKVKGDKVKVRVLSNVEKINMLGEYKSELNVSSLQLKPKGFFNVTLFDATLRVIANGDIYTKDDMRYLRLNDIEIEPKIRDLIVKANGIFPDPELDELAVNIANSYWRDIYAIVLPETRPAWAPVVLRQINQALLHVPIDQFIQPSQ
ncbi:hypothetical protein AWZ03_007928 [Drosophila navojoa]|uniref:Circadian clock-controlled protein n=1 Tax=Drosophila navojoa TaxID=7232 RepID=A0A484BA39_DRONA|nr:uncharacterized protein LOC115563050 [Drosophila navojoa]TDG45653.1 hypothetical protein AWZ03_007928 [Drosophila navojoa]